jgi:hypothetical protein
MRNQTKVFKTNGSPETASRAMARDVGEFADGVLTLAELQVQLFVADAKEYSRRALIPGLVLLCGMTLGIACLPIALAAFALWLIQVFEISYAAGFLIVAAAGMVFSLLLCVLGWFQVRKCWKVLQRSQRELVHNLGWIKKVLQHQRTTRINGLDNSWRTVT